MFFDKDSPDKDFPLLADISNGTKHYKLTRQKTCRLNSQTIIKPRIDVNVNLDEGRVLHPVCIEIAGKHVDLLDFIKRIHNKLKNLPNRIDQIYSLYT